LIFTTLAIEMALANRSIEILFSISKNAHIVGPWKSFKKTQ